ncbi:MAG: BMP family protein [Synergistaceae bacterium]|jgi:basic membrane protein A|nr:BMP family protein [Synergistaceae bacterium]
MKRNLSIIFVVFMVFALVMTGFASKGESDEKKSVAMILPGLKTDEAFNQYTYEGMLRAQKELGIETASREEVTQDEQLEVIRQFAQQGFGIIIGQGGQFGEALQTVAKEFPDQHFVFSVGTDTGGVPNLTAATVSYSHAGYLGGIMAAHTTKRNKVAMITGEWYDPHRQLEASFKAGVAAVNKDVEVTSVTIGSWSDVNKAREASLALIADGYDVLLPCLDAAFVGVLAAAEDSDNVFVVGSVVDMAQVAPDVTVGSVVFNWEELGYQEASGKLLDGKTHILGMAENGITPVTGKLLSAEGKAAVEEAIEALKAGKIDVAP